MCLSRQYIFKKTSWVMAFTLPGANPKQDRATYKVWRSPTHLRDIMANKKAIFSMTFFSDANSNGSKGTRDNPLRTVARSHAGTLAWAADLILHVPWRNHATNWVLPRGPSPNRVWKATIAATYTLNVDRVIPAEKRSWRNFSTEATGQLTGSNPHPLHPSSIHKAYVYPQTGYILGREAHTT